MNLFGKRVLFVDIETTGFPKRKGMMPGGYNSYKINSCYDGSRIIQLAYAYTPKFTLDSSIDVYAHYIHFTESIKIPLHITKITGITDDMCANGIKFDDILAGIFGKYLMECDVIAAYNAWFDFSIIANEISRCKNRSVLFNKMMHISDTNNVVCVMNMGSKLVGRKRISQAKLYNALFGEEPDNQHNAYGDVCTMLRIAKHCLTNDPKIISPVVYIPIDTNVYKQYNIKMENNTMYVNYDDCDE